MRRSAALLIPLVAIGATISTAIPAGAGQPDRAEFTVAECFFDGTEPVLLPGLVSAWPAVQAARASARRQPSVLSHGGTRKGMRQPQPMGPAKVERPR